MITSCRLEKILLIYSTEHWGWKVSKNLFPRCSRLSSSGYKLYSCEFPLKCWSLTKKGNVLTWITGQTCRYFLVSDSMSWSYVSTQLSEISRQMHHFKCVSWYLSGITGASGHFIDHLYTANRALLPQKRFCFSETPTVSSCCNRWISPPFTNTNLPTQ